MIPRPTSITKEGRPRRGALTGVLQNKVTVYYALSKYCLKALSLNGSECLNEEP